MTQSHRRRGEDVTSKVDRLEPGPATAFAVATVETQDGQVVETYKWTVLTHLRHCH
jgi:hypothetical protein